MVFILLRDGILLNRGGLIHLALHNALESAESGETACGLCLEDYFQKHVLTWQRHVTCPVCRGHCERIDNDTTTPRTLFNEESDGHTH